MNIKKIQSGVKIEGTVNIFLDPVKISNEDINIITDPTKNINNDRVFNLPGNYELNGVMIAGFNGEKYAFLIKDTISILYFVVPLPAKTIQEIQEAFGDIDCVIAPEIKDSKIFIEKLGVKIFITIIKPLKISDFAF